MTTLQVLLDSIAEYIRSTEPQPSTCASCGHKEMGPSSFSPMPSGAPWRCLKCNGDRWLIWTYCPSADPRILLSECADILASARPAPHLCAGCHHRWEGPLPGAELCGDCWRKAQATVMARPAPQGWQPIATVSREGKFGATVLLIGGGWRHAFAGIVNGDFGACYIDGIGQMYGATHWMPLPSLPAVITGET